MEINLSFRTIWRSHNFSCPVLTDVPVKKMTVAIAGVNVKWKLICGVKKQDLFPFQIGEVNFHDLMDNSITLRFTSGALASTDILSPKVTLIRRIRMRDRRL